MIQVSFVDESGVRFLLSQEKEKGSNAQIRDTSTEEAACLYVDLTFSATSFNLSGQTPHDQDATPHLNPNARQCGLSILTCHLKSFIIGEILAKTDFLTKQQLFHVSRVGQQRLCAMALENEAQEELCGSLQERGR